MAYTLPQDSTANFTKGFDQFLVYIATEVPIFIPMLLFSFFLVVFLGGFFSESRRTGASGDWVKWFAVAGYLTTVIAVVFTLSTDGLINLETLVITFTISFIGTALLIFRGRD